MTHNKEALSLERIPHPEKLLLKSQFQGRASSPQGSPSWASVPCTLRRLDSVVDSTPPPATASASLGIPGWKTWSFLKEEADETPSLLQLVSASQEPPSSDISSDLLKSPPCAVGLV